MNNLYLGVYGEINHGAHRKPADLIGAPAFIWHQALWNPVAGDKQSRDKRAERINGYLTALHAKITSVDSGVSPELQDILVEYDDRVRASTLEFVWLGVRAKIRIENHTEYLSLTSIIDASVDLSAVLEERRNELQSQPLLSTNIRQKIENFRNGTHRPFNSDDLPTFPDLNDTHKFVYYDIWDEWFFPEILNADDYLSSSDDGPLKIGGLRFADIRGFITCEEYPINRDEQKEEDRLKANRGSDFFLLDSRVQGPFYKTEEERRGQWQRTWIPSEEWARRRLDNAWPFLSMARSRSPMPGRTEFTVSRLLDGRVLYASALGPQPQLGTTTSGLERPVLFYAHSVTQCERQIGRLADRLCQLGTLRLAALVPLPALKAVPEQLTKVEDIINETRNQTHQLIQVSKSGLTAPSELETDILKNLEEIQRLMNDLSAGRSVLTSAKIGDAPLEYRLQRSAYYKTIFYSLFSGMRIKRLEGYQPYDEFIKHRLQSAFGFIESLEARIRAVRTDWRALDQLYLSAAVTVLTHQIDQQQRTVADSQRHLEDLQAQAVEIQANTQSVLNNTERAQNEIMIIQLVGEFLLTIFLVPYYVLNIWLHALNCEHEDWCAETDLWEGGLNVVTAMTISIVCLCLIVGVVRLLHNRRKMAAKKAAHL
jgi:uncharacterized membrane-anchored protein